MNTIAIQPMSRVRFAVWFVFYIAAVWGANAATPEAKKAAEQANRFAFQFLKLTRDDETNYAFSPYSIRSAFAVLAVGAAGDTLGELRKTFSYPDGDTLGTEELALREALIASAKEHRIDITAVNSLWVHEGFAMLKPFLEVANSRFGTDVARVDFVKNPGNAAAQ